MMTVEYSRALNEFKIDTLFNTLNFNMRWAHGREPENDWKLVGVFEEEFHAVTFVNFARENFELTIEKNLVQYTEDFMNIGAAWIKETKAGEKYFSCVINIPLLGKLNFAIFRNKEKKSETAPDYQIVWNDREGGKGENHFSAEPDLF